MQEKFFERSCKPTMLEMMNLSGGIDSYVDRMENIFEPLFQNGEIRAGSEDDKNLDKILRRKVKGLAYLHSMEIVGISGLAIYLIINYLT